MFSLIFCKQCNNLSALANQDSEPGPRTAPYLAFQPQCSKLQLQWYSCVIATGAIIYWTCAWAVVHQLRKSNPQQSADTILAREFWADNDDNAANGTYNGNVERLCGADVVVLHHEHSACYFCQRSSATCDLPQKNIQNWVFEPGLKVRLEFVLWTVQRVWTPAPSTGGLWRDFREFQIKNIIIVRARL